MNNLTITGNGGPAINVFESSSATGGTMKVRIDGNHVGNAAVSGSGTTLDSGIRVFLQGKTTSTVTLVNNIVRQTPGSRGIDVEARGPTVGSQPTTVADVVITGNDVDTNDENNPSGSLDAIYVAADDQGSPAQINAEIHDNTIPSATGLHGCYDWPTFDGNAPWLYYRIATSGGVAKLFVSTWAATPTQMWRFRRRKRLARRGRTSRTLEEFHLTATALAACPCFLHAAASTRLS